MKRFWHAALSLSLVLSAFAAVNFAADDAKVDPLDWPYWRGPEGNSISRETGLPDTINPRGGAGSNLLWKKEEGAGRGTPIIMRGKIYLLTRDNPDTALEREKVLCLDAATGKTLWENKFNVWSSQVPDTRVGWSSPVGDPETGKVYALGVNGLFMCLDGESGKTLWSVPLHERYGLVSTYGGRTNYPIVVDDFVILGSVTVGWGENGVPAHRLWGFDKATGEVHWQTSTRLRPEGHHPQRPDGRHIQWAKGPVDRLGGRLDLCLPARDGQEGLGVSPVAARHQYLADRRWRRRLRQPQRRESIRHQIRRRGRHPRQPGRKHHGSGPRHRKGSRTEGGDLEGAWDGRRQELDSQFEDRLYCCDDSGKMNILEAKDGTQVGRQNLGTTSFASPLYADGKIYCLEMSRWYVLKPDARLGRQKAGAQRLWLV
jgi:outer membrane protein assembly factor BamB